MTGTDGLPPSSQKQFIAHQREIFFDEILAAIRLPPGEVDRIMGQDMYYAPPQEDGIILDAGWGNLVFTIAVKDDLNEVHKFMYSIYQIGIVIKIGILWSGYLKDVPQSEEDEIHEGFWQNVVKFVRSSRRGESVLTEWEFSEPELYLSWSRQETYVLGMRHLHFKVLKIVSNFIKKQLNRNTILAVSELVEGGQNHSLEKNVLKLSPKLLAAVNAKPY